MAAGGERFPRRGLPAMLFGRGRRLDTTEPTAAREVHGFLAAGCRVHVDPSLPKDTAQFVDDDGVPVLTVKNLQP